MDYTPEQIARICHAAEQVRLFVTGSRLVPWSDITTAERDLWIANVKAIQGGLHPLFQDNLAGPIVHALTEARPPSMVAEFVDFQRAGGQLTARELGELGRDWLASHAPWLVDAGESARWRFEQLIVALGMFIAEHKQQGGDPDADGEKPELRLTFTGQDTAEAAEKFIEAWEKQAKRPVVWQQDMQIEPRSPRVGDRVHYVSHGTPGGEYLKECRAADVTEVPPGVTNPQTIGLCVLNPGGLFFNRSNTRDDGQMLAAGPTSLCGALDYRGGSWHWPAA